MTCNRSDQQDQTDKPSHHRAYYLHRIFLIVFAIFFYLFRGIFLTLFLT